MITQWLDIQIINKQKISGILEGSSWMQNPAVNKEDPC